MSASLRSSSGFMGRRRPRLPLPLLFFFTNGGDQDGPHDAPGWWLRLLGALRSRPPRRRSTLPSILLSPSPPLLQRWTGAKSPSGSGGQGVAAGDRIYRGRPARVWRSRDGRRVAIPRGVASIARHQHSKQQPWGRRELAASPVSPSRQRHGEKKQRGRKIRYDG
jgi:hypothetical protein